MYLRYSEPELYGTKILILPLVTIRDVEDQGFLFRSLSSSDICSFRSPRCNEGVCFGFRKHIIDRRQSFMLLINERTSGKMIFLRKNFSIR